jgi:predicted nucleic acid-binding Zn ribbon protein
MNPEKSCPICETIHRNFKFCSNKCVGKSQKKSKYTKCLKCGKETSNPKFCSQRCNASYNTKGRILTEEQKEKIRLSVLKKLYPDGNFPARKKKTFLKYRYKDIKFLSENNLFNEATINQKKRILYYEKGNRCEICGYEYTDEKTGKGPFEIHHIDGDNKNWNRENLKIYCLNCHWKTPNYRFRNRKHTEESKEKFRRYSSKKQINAE